MKPSDDRREILERKLETLVNARPVSFNGLKKSAIDTGMGVYLISEEMDGEEIPLYVGRTKSFPDRLYNGHLMGAPRSSARLKKYLIKDEIVSNASEAKKYIRENCSFRLVKVDDLKLRSSLEGYALALLEPEYGHYEEH